MTDKKCEHARISYRKQEGTCICRECGEEFFPEDTVEALFDALADVKSFLSRQSTAAFKAGTRADRALRKAKL